MVNVYDCVLNKSILICKKFVFGSFEMWDTGKPAFACKCLSLLSQLLLIVCTIKRSLKNNDDCLSNCSKRKLWKIEYFC